MLACLLWFDMRTEWKHNQGTGQSAQPALYDAMDAVLDRQRDTLAFPRRFDGTIKEIWALQSRFEQRSGARPYRLLDHPRFRAGYDFLVIRARGGDTTAELSDWWTRFQDADSAEQARMLLPVQAGEVKRRRRRRRSGHSPGEAVEVRLD
jgi:poly(A) polymerase